MADQFWIVEDADGTQHVLLDDPTPAEVIIDLGEGEEPETEMVDRYPEAVKRGLLPAFLDLNTQRWDFDTSSAIPKWNREAARAKRWDEAKEYHLLMVNFGFAIPGIGWIQTDAASREAIRTLHDEAKDEIDAGNTEWGTSFKNLENERVPVSGEEIIMVYRALRAFLGACISAKDAAEDRITAAYEGEATIDQILEVDITSGYPV